MKQEKTKYMIVERKNSLKQNKIGHLKIKKLQYQSAQQTAHTPFHDMPPHLHTICNDVILLNVLQKCNFSQALFKLPEDGLRPKHVGAIISCILM